MVLELPGVIGPLINMVKVEWNELTLNLIGDLFWLDKFTPQSHVNPPKNQG